MAWVNRGFPGSIKKNQEISSDIFQMRCHLYLIMELLPTLLALLFGTKKNRNLTKKKHWYWYSNTRSPTRDNGWNPSWHYTHIICNFIISMYIIHMSHSKYKRSIISSSRLRSTTTMLTMKPCPRIGSCCDQGNCWGLPQSRWQA